MVPLHKRKNETDHCSRQEQRSGDHQHDARKDHLQRQRERKDEAEHENSDRPKEERQTEPNETQATNEHDTSNPGNQLVHRLLLSPSVVQVAPVQPLLLVQELSVLTECLLNLCHSPPLVPSSATA